MNNWTFENNIHKITLNNTDHLTLDNIPTEDNKPSSIWIARLDCTSLENYYDIKRIETPDVNLAKTYALEFAISSLHDHVIKTQTIIDIFNKILEQNKE